MSVMRASGYASLQFCVAVAGGLTVNDFVMASKINTLDFSDLQNKKKARTFFI